MNIDEKIKAKVESIDKKMEKGMGVDIFKLQSCSRELQHMGPIGMRGCTHQEEDESLKSGALMIQKLMLLQTLKMFEESISEEK